MRLALVCVGKLKAGPERLLFDRYFKRLKEGARERRPRRRRCSRDRRIAGAAAGRTAGRGRRRDPGGRAEGRRAGLARRARAPATSEEWAADIGRARDASRPAYAVAIGGPDGLDPSLGAAAASNRELRRDDLAAPARPGDGRRAALPGDDNSRRPSLSSRDEPPRYWLDFVILALHVGERLEPHQASGSRRRRSRRLRSARRGRRTPIPLRRIRRRGRSGAREQGDRAARGRRYAARLGGAAPGDRGRNRVDSRRSGSAVGGADRDHRQGSGRRARRRRSRRQTGEPQRHGRRALAFARAPAGGDRGCACRPSAHGQQSPARHSRQAQRHVGSGAGGDSHERGDPGI